METTATILRFLNLILSFLVVIFVVKIVYRTEKQLDKVFKLLLVSAVVLLVASFLGFDYYFGIIPADWSRLVVLGSRALAIFFFVMASCKMIKLINDESCK